MPGESELMEAIKRVCGAAIAQAEPSSSVPAAFWAALTANESGANIVRGDSIETIKRREPAVYRHLALVAAGFKPRYGSITQSDIDHAEGPPLGRPVACHQQFLSQAPANMPPNSAAHSAVTVDDLLRWSTSWGWTQLMGYHAIEWDIPVDDLWSPSVHYRLAGRLMDGFVKQFSLDPQRQFEAMARCWNTGSPTGTTYSADYVPNLLQRIDVWNSL